MGFNFILNSPLNCLFKYTKMLSKRINIGYYFHKAAASCRKTPNAYAVADEFAEQARTAILVLRISTPTVEESILIKQKRKDINMLQTSGETCSQPCNLCGGIEVSVLATKSRSGKPLRTVICENCGLVWSDPLPHNPQQFYADDYRLEYKGTYAPKPKHILRAGKVALSRREMLDKYLSQPKKILDVGTGGGEFAYLLKKSGHDINGIEPNKGYARYSQSTYGLNIQNGFIQDIKQPDESFDLITIWHVLEHTENPTAVIQKLYNLLKPEGVLVVEVPSVEATCQAPKSTFHEAHIFNFNLDTLRKLGEKIGFAGLEHHYSPDRANITVFFQKKTLTGAAPVLTLPGNAGKIKSIVASHSAGKHYLTLQPYVRLVKKLARSLQEKLDASDKTSGKELLDNLYR